MQHAELHARVRSRGVNPIVYWLARAVLQPFFHLYFRLSRIGREHVPADGPVILAANHRSFLDPFIIGTLVRRPVYYVAKRELFEKRWQGWLLNALGAFPVDRGRGDAEMIESCKAILARGDCVVIFPEGTRVRPGPLGRPKRGVGRLALETGAPVVPVALIGTEAIRRGWRIRPCKVRVRVGRPLTFPRVASASPQLAGAVAQRIWPCIELQWEWLGGAVPPRRAAVVGTGAPAAELAGALSRAGLEVTFASTPRVPARPLPAGVRAANAGALPAEPYDLVCLAVPAAELPATVAAHRAAVDGARRLLVAAPGLVPPLGTPPSAWLAEQVRPGAIACLAGAGPRIVAAADRGLARVLADELTRGGLAAEPTRDVAGAELAQCAAHTAAAAAAAARTAGAAAAGAAAGRVFAEVAALGRARGAEPSSFSGPLGTGALVAELVAAPPRSGDEAGAVALVARALRDGGVDAPAVEGLSEVLAGQVEPAAWTASVATGRRPTAGARAA